MTAREPLRRRLLPPVHVRMGPGRRAESVGTGARTIATGFALILGAGWLLLALPFATTSGASAGPLDALFTAVSAVCVTGLVVVDTPSHWSWFGEAVILLLIQVGGLGYMLGTTVVLWALGRRLGLRDRHLLRLYYGAPSLHETMSFAKSLAVFALLFECAGAMLLFLLFWSTGEPPGRSLWWGVFHSVSAFNNAGFSITGRDMIPYAGNPAVLAVLASLVVAGSVGFLPIVTLVHRGAFSRLPLDHKLIFATSAALLAAGGLVFTAVEWTNPHTLGDLAPADRPVVGLFYSASARTAGFNAVEFDETRDETKITVVGLMFIGGAAGSTSGGVKVGAFALLFAMMLSTLRGEEHTTVLGRRVPSAIVRQATTLALYLVALVFAFTLALAALSDAPILDVLVEVVSAIATTGYSSAATATFDTPGRILLIAAMLAGRFSPLMLVLSMNAPRHRVPYRYAEDSVRLG